MTGRLGVSFPYDFLCLFIIFMSNYIQLSICVSNYHKILFLKMSSREADKIIICINTLEIQELSLSDEDAHLSYYNKSETFC